RGPTISHQAVGLEAGMANLEALLARVSSAATIKARDRQPIAELSLFCLAGADYPSDVRLLSRAIEGLGVARTVVVLNDTFAALRAGTHRPWGVALIC